jgi:hypothetical protein
MMKKKYFKCRDGSLYTKYTKEEICNLIDPYSFDTIEPFLQEMDYPAIYDEEYVCDGVGCETCTFEPCYYGDDAEC